MATIVERIITEWLESEAAGGGAPVPAARGHDDGRSSEWTSGTVSAAWKCDDLGELGELYEYAVLVTALEEVLGSAARRPTPTRPR